MKPLPFLPLVCLLTLTGPLAHAATYTVTTPADDGSANTLRWAIEWANSNPGSTINITNNLGNRLHEPTPFDHGRGDDQRRRGQHGERQQCLSHFLHRHAERRRCRRHQQPHAGQRPRQGR